MSLMINTNIDAFDAHRNLVNTENSLSKSMQRLSSGLRINSAADDAAGLAISQKLTGQVRGLDQAQRNAQDGVSMVQTAEGSLNQVHAMLQRIRELAVQYTNGTLAASDQGAIMSEVDQLQSEIARIGTSVAQFNGIALFSGRTTITFQVGANDGEQIGVDTQAIGVDRRHDQPRPATTTLALDRQVHQRRVRSAGNVRCRSEPPPVHAGQSLHLRGEPECVTQPDP